MAEPHRVRNEQSRRRLIAVAHRVAASSSVRETAEGWSPSTILGHLAHWDRFVLARWHHANRTGSVLPVVLPDLLTGLVNEAAAPQWAALSPAAAATAVIEAAEAVDHFIAGLSADVVATIGADGRWALVDRSLHRIPHLDEIERGWVQSAGR